MKHLLIPVAFIVFFALCSADDPFESCGERLGELREKLRCTKRKLCDCQVKEGQCPPGFVKNETMCYWFSPFNTREAWPSAKTLCETMDSYLAILKTETEDNVVRDYLLTIPSNNDKYWIGGQDFQVPGLFQWSTLRYPTFMDYTSWMPGAPGNADSYCIALDMDGGYQWNNWYCQATEGFICMQSLKYLTCDS